MMPMPGVCVWVYLPKRSIGVLEALRHHDHAFPQREDDEGKQEQDNRLEHGDLRVAGPQYRSSGTHRAGSRKR